jgi:hypothetical protein
MFEVEYCGFEAVVSLNEFVKDFLFSLDGSHMSNMLFLVLLLHSGYLFVKPLRIDVEHLEKPIVVHKFREFLGTLREWSFGVTKKFYPDALKGVHVSAGGFGASVVMGIQKSLVEDFEFVVGEARWFGFEFGFEFGRLMKQRYDG